MTSVIRFTKDLSQPKFHPIMTDMTLTLELQVTELVAAGFPCTDVSRAGHRKGLQGKVIQPYPPLTLTSYCQWCNSLSLHAAEQLASVSMQLNSLHLSLQSTCLVQHVFRLLKAALDDNRGIPWVLLENVEGLLDRIEDRPPVIEYVVDQLEEMSYSWAHRIVDTAGAALTALLCLCSSC